MSNQTSKSNTSKKHTPKASAAKAKAPKRSARDNGLTELVFILDRSGSMGGLEADTIGGFNSMIEKQKGKAGEVIVSTVLFDDRMEVLHNRLPLALIRPLTPEQYYVRGSTALLDAVGRAINHIGDLQKYTAPAKRPAHTLVIITTDGQENASREYSAAAIKQILERQQKKFGWEFIFLGANIDSVTAAAEIGIQAGNAVNYCHDAAGTKLNYDCMSSAIMCVRAGTPLNGRGSSRAWRQKIDRDYKARQK